MIRVLVVGYGSIGQRHARILSDLGCKVAVVTQQTTEAMTIYSELSEALDTLSPDYVVIAVETARHVEILEALARLGYRGKLLVEKPLSDTQYTSPSGIFARLAVAYNLRFHPVLSALRARLAGVEVLAVDVRAGQHLAEWRPDRDFRQTYSAFREQGGGVLRDLSHELDYLLWLFGPWRRVAALGGSLGALQIDADEHYSALMVMAQAPVVQLRLSYLDRPARREIVVTTRDATLTADLMAGTLGVDGVIAHYECDRDTSYRAMHLAMLEDEGGILCSAAEGTAVGGLVAALEQAAAINVWVAA
ncbi:Gfo/Idh/MocA family oxidoreductase (plasmid) [Pseudohalocynthiibacter aestuariivivens]|uniref:Gfo/Idh/MocA family oxidoreductase n=1 Tax=Roseovarius pelagicus TaxID=2980108 RepID=A0ABY6D5P6_9RHOB|nr:MULTISPECIES: Gfo/Idh/MocA family oxidoreductase [Rhodobacterales]QIE47830.1 Gfo/Idh/MocA family oxidoreductase [Pseudohalocynthiibacter aestuariivivens]UXX81428.1 Gfo/Idh/MocA family oxidoreductase [Roseovarius pelagicus]